MEIMEVIEDVKDKVGDKGFYLILAGLGLLFVYSLSKDSGSGEDTLVTVNTTASYPDAVTNADVIISTLQDSLEYSEQVIVNKLDESQDSLSAGFGSIQDKQDSIQQVLGEIQQAQGEIQQSQVDLETSMGENFEAVNDYINKGLASQEKLMEENFDSIMGGLDDMKDSFKAEESSTGKAVMPTRPAIPVTGFYTYETRQGLNTSTSIVDALKAIGVNSSMANRKKIAEANGILGYTGTREQNTQMLSMLKQGILRKV